MDVIFDWKSIGSLLATLMFIRTAVRDFLPPEVNQALKRFMNYILAYLQPKMVTILVEEYANSYNNEIYDSVILYLGSKCFSAANSMKLSKSNNSKNFTFTMATDQTLEDTYDGVKLTWSFHIVETKNNSLGYSRSGDSRYFRLSFHPKYKEMVNSTYLPYVLKQAEIIKFKNRERKLYTNRPIDENGRLWSSVSFTHPSSFDTVAIDPILKQEIKDDLVKFVKRREFYNRVGRAWKRGYLLYGPPGTGKTSLIAAIANLLEYDIYDLELTAVTNNSQLRKLLISTKSKSVIVVEDIDCSLDLSDRKKNNEMMMLNEEMMSKEKILNINSPPKKNNFSLSTVSLSGVLNFVDGLWSSCGEERLIIFTTNHIDKLDSALLRPGRMDKHIELSYCTAKSFKILAKNYLKIEEHDIMKEVEDMLKLGLVKMTPADVAEIFMSCDEDVEMGMTKVLDEMKKRSIKDEETKENEEDKEEEPVIN